MGKSKKLTGFLELIQSKNITEKEISNILADNPDIIMDIWFSIKGTDISDNDIDLAVESTDSLLKKMNKESLIPVFSEDASYMDWAKSFGIDEEADEITLTKYMFQKNFPEKISVAEQFDTDMDMVNKNLSDMMDEKFRIGCLCTDYKNKLMWSHYGNGHKGFCIEYDFGIDCNELNDTLILPVLYSNERPKIPWDVIFAPDKDDPQVKKQAAKHMIKSLLTKDSAWEYEDEWRVIMLGDNIYPNKKMPPITCIYIGALCEENDKKELLKIAQSNNIPVKQMVVDRGEYTVHAKTLDYLKEGM